MNKADADKCVKCGTFLLPVTTIKVSDDVKIDSDELTPSIKPKLGYLTVYLPSHNHSMHTKLKSEIVFGRGTGIDQPPDIDLTAYYGVQAGVSRRHALVKFTADTANLEDLGSSNGTWLNEVRLESGQNRTLRSGDIIRLGNFLMFVYFTFSQKTEQTLVLRDRSNSLENGLTESYLTDNLLSFISGLQSLKDTINTVLKRKDALPILVRKIEFDERTNLVRLTVMETDDVIQLLRDKVVTSKESPNGPTSDEKAILLATSQPTIPLSPKATNAPKPDISDSVSQLLAKIAGDLSEDQLTQYQMQFEDQIQKLLANRLEILRL
jgi:pSer/pThr/pTyr-binding forkhead associated (FHA) protein